LLTTHIKKTKKHRFFFFFFFFLKGNDVYSRIYKRMQPIYQKPKLNLKVFEPF
jgi:hypothetical protein